MKEDIFHKNVEKVKISINSDIPSPFSAGTGAFAILLQNKLFFLQFYQNQRNAFLLFPFAIGRKAFLFLFILCLVNE